MHFHMSDVGFEPLPTRLPRKKEVPIAQIRIMAITVHVHSVYKGSYIFTYFPSLQLHPFLAFYTDMTLQLY